MQVHRGVPRRHDRAPCALSIGNFDGVHRGHQALLAQLVDHARPRGWVPTVMTFEPHPREFFTPERAPARISNLRDKLIALDQAGVAVTVVQHFNRRFAELTAERFVEDVVIGGCNARLLAVGDDFRFGARRAGDVALLQRYASAGHFDLMQMPTFLEGGVRVSSTAVREALASGDLERARALLGRPYAISGHVLHGRKLGRSLGFPTLNLRLARVRPAVHGVFVVHVHGLGPRALAGVASVGQRPTVDASGRWLLEVHLLDFAADAYGALISVEFLEKLREEQKYDTLEALTAAIRDDAERARSHFGKVVTT